MSSISATNWESFFGPTLLTKNSSGESVSVGTNEHLANKASIMIYFSAHWCPPCRGFTPELVTFYNNLKSSGQNFECVFVSSDKDDASFNEYYHEMPWASLPFADRAAKAKLSAKYGVQGIPTLVVLNGSGELVTKKGREMVSSDPSGSSFPWTPKTFAEDLGTSFVGKSGSVDATSFAGKFIGIYFSAHWCPPCRGFTPKLIEFYNRRKTLGHNDFEIIFCSSDHGQAEFDSYFAEMPWLAIPFKDARIRALSSRFEVEGIPAFVILDAAGNVINKEARGSIVGDPEGTKFPFYPEPVEDISVTLESFGCDINSKPALIAFMESADDSEQAAAKAVLASFGERLAKQKASDPDGPEMIFFYSFKPSQISDMIRQKTQLGPASKATAPVLVLLDIPSGGAFHVSPADEVTQETVSAFIEGYKAGALERKQLSR